MMNNDNSEREVSIVSAKTASIKKQHRQHQLNKRFNSIRKLLIKAHIATELQTNKVKQTQNVSILVKNVQLGVEGAVLRLWEHCVAFSFRFLTEEHITVLGKKLASSKEQNCQEQLSMLTWLIANWSFSIKQLQLNHTGLVKLLASLLGLNTSLNKYILYALHNFCCHQRISILLLQINFIQKALSAHQQAQISSSDLSFFLVAILESLPKEYELKENILMTIIIFLKSTLSHNLKEPFLLEECIYIIQKLVTINNCNFSSTVIYELKEQLKRIAFALENSSDCRAWASIYELYALIYSQPSVTQENFLQHDFCQHLWLMTRNFLLSQDLSSYAKQERDVEIFQEQMWSFLNIYLKLPSKIVQEALLWLQQHCLTGQAFDWEEKALTLTVSVLQPEKSLYVIVGKLREFQSLDEPTTAMLKALHAYTSNHQILCTAAEFDQLFQVLRDLKQESERPDISSLAQKVFYLLNQKA